MQHCRNDRNLELQVQNYVEDTIISKNSGDLTGTSKIAHKCNNLNYLDYRYLQNSNKFWYCIECSSTIFPFNSLSSNKNYLACCTNTDNNSTHWIDLKNDHNSSLSLKPSNLELLVNQFNNATPEKVCLSKYYDIEEMRKIQIPHKNKSLSVFHINACSLNKNFDDLQHLLNCTKKILT